MSIYRYGNIILNLKKINYVNIITYNDGIYRITLRNTFINDKKIITYKNKEEAHKELNKIHKIMKSIK